MKGSWLGASQDPGADDVVRDDAREGRLADGHRTRPCALSGGGAVNLPSVLLRFAGGPVW